MSWMEHLKILLFIRKWIAERSDIYSLLSTPDDISQCRNAGKLGVVFDIEGMHPVQDDVSLVETFYKLGVRWMSIAYNRSNSAGGGCLDEDGGLTSVGRTIIHEMQRVGMVLCLSHTGARTAFDALECSNHPVIFSHSNPYGATSHVRNVSDELMRACARKGGVIGLTGFGPYLGAITSADTVGCLLRQLRYVIDLVGIQHVGLGLDFVFDRDELNEYLRSDPTLFPDLDPAAGFPMVEPEALEDIAEALARENFTDEQIRCVLGLNWVRVATSVWR